MPRRRGGYLVAQLGDLVRIDRPGPLYGTFGEVVDQRTSLEEATRVTGRICVVRSDGGAVVEVSADLLEVLDDEHGVPAAWERCSDCEGRGEQVIPAHLLGGREEHRRRCPRCEGYGWKPPIRCEGCGHPMSEGTWEDPPMAKHLGYVMTRETGRKLAMRNAVEFPVNASVHYSPCDEGCTHAGPMRWGDGRLVPLGAGADAALIGDHHGVEASWRQVDVRTLGWPHDRVLCLRCYAERSR